MAKKEKGINVCNCEQCGEQLIECDAIRFPMPVGLPDLIFHEDCFDEWIDDGKTYTYFKKDGSESEE